MIIYSTLHTLLFTYSQELKHDVQWKKHKNKQLTSFKIKHSYSRWKLFQITLKSDTYQYHMYVYYNLNQNSLAVEKSCSQEFKVMLNSICGILYS